MYFFNCFDVIVWHSQNLELLKNVEESVKKEIAQRMQSLS